MENLRYRCMWCSRFFDADNGIVFIIKGVPYTFCSPRCMELWAEVNRDHEDEEVIEALES